MVQLSQYCRVFPSDDSPGSVILFLTKSSAVVELPSLLFHQIQTSGLTAEDEGVLRDLGFLVDDPETERREMLSLAVEQRTCNPVLSMRLVLNLDCNLACRYCFEGKRKGSFYMSSRTADRFVEFAADAMNRKNKGRKELHITFYGGEPLLSVELICSISIRLSAAAERTGIRYSFSLMTNGTLLTGKVVQKLMPLGLTDVYVTLDGPKDIHDCARPFKGSGSSFDSIVRNLREVCGNIAPSVGGNFTETNFKRFPELLDYMAEVGLTPEKLKSVQFFPVVDESPDFRPAGFRDGLVTFNAQWFSDASIYLREEILKRGYKTERISPASCMFESQCGLMINYDGNVFRCPGQIGREEFACGNIFSGVKDVSPHGNSWNNNECLSCPYLPLCFGGCRYMKYVRDGNMDGVDCRKPYLDATLEAMVKQDIRYGLAY